MNPTARILLIDDDSDDQLLFCEALKMIDAELTCTVAENGQQGYEQAASHPRYDIIFLDLNMPVMDGYACLKKIRLNPELRDIPVIILTTSNNVYNDKDTKALGASAYITKPKSLTALFNELKNVLKIHVPILVS